MMVIPRADGAVAKQLLKKITISTMKISGLTLVVRMMDNIKIAMLHFV